LTSGRGSRPTTSSAGDAPEVFVLEAR
jgi:hypothetical protein